MPPPLDYEGAIPELGRTDSVGRASPPADVVRLVYQLDGSRHALYLRQAVGLRRGDERDIGSRGLALM